MKVETDVKVNKEAVERLSQTKAGKALLRAARYVRKVARHSIKFVPKKKRKESYSKQASSPGTPPHTRSGRLKKAILYEITGKKSEAFIGPSFNVIAGIGGLHERGGTRATSKKIKKYKLGSVGPIDVDEKGGIDQYAVKYRKAKLKTPDMVRRANELVEENTPKRIKEKFPARPFIGPAFEKSKPHIMRFFHNP